MEYKDYYQALGVARQAEKADNITSSRKWCDLACSMNSPQAEE